MSQDFPPNAQPSFQLVFFLQTLKKNIVAFQKKKNIKEINRDVAFNFYILDIIRTCVYSVSMAA